MITGAFIAPIGLKYNSLFRARTHVIHNQEEINRLNAMEASRREKLRQIAEQNGKAVESAAKFLNISFQANLSKLSAEVRSQIEASASSYASQIGTLHPDFSSQVEAIRNQAAEINSRASSARSAIDAISKQYADAFAKLAAQTAEKATRAEMTLSEADKLLAQIRGLHPEVRTPTDYAALESTRANIAASIASGDHEAALIASQDIILRASRLLTQLLVDGEQYGSVLREVQSKLAAVQARADRLRAETGEIAVTLGGEEYEYPYDIAFWSNGSFAEISNQIDGVAARVQGLAEKPTSMDSLRHILSEIEAADKQLTECDRESRNRLAGAIAVENTAQRLHDTLSTHGWKLESAGRTDEDNRKPYSLVYQDVSGNKISFVVSSGQNPENPDCFCEAFSKTKSMADIVKSSVDATLKSGGMMPGGDAVRRNDCSSNPTPEAFIKNITNEVQRMNRSHTMEAGYQTEV